MGRDARVGFRKFQESYRLKEDREFVRLNHLNDLNLDFNLVLSSTLIYTHVLNRGGRGVNSPADHLCYNSGSVGWNNLPIVMALSRRAGRLLSEKFDIDKLG